MAGREPRTTLLDRIEAGGPCYVIAEAGSNHNGDLELALRLIRVAADAGADAVKFQLFRAAKLYPREAGSADYLRDDEDIYDIVERMELPLEWLPQLAAAADEAGIDFIVSPFDEESADAVDPYVSAFKLASYELTHHPLLRHIAAKGKPLVVSTGAADLAEVGEALEVARGEGNEQVVVLQCTAAYPAAIEALNLGALATLRSELGLQVGLSDHSSDPVIAPVMAVALGASVIEKHFTLDRTLPGPDHKFALEPEELARMVAAIREAEKALGSGRKEVLPDEQELREFARRSVFAVRDIPAGSELEAGNVAVLRTGKREHGADPADLGRLLGRRVRRPIEANAPIRWEDVEE
jgi:N-acetylneuraminate synthase